MATHVIGQTVFELELPAAGRDCVALFSEATEDPNPIHTDDDFAKAAGFSSVLQQGPMTTAQFARLLEQAFGVDRLRSLDVTFTAPVVPEDTLILSAIVEAVGASIRCRLTARKADGTQTARGLAEVAG